MCGELERWTHSEMKKKGEKKKKTILGSHFVSRFSELFGEIHQKHPCVSFTGLPQAVKQTKL